MYHKHERTPLDGVTCASALTGYDTSSDPANVRLAERFSTSAWSLSALGSNGVVWADGSVARLLGPAFRFGAGDVVRLIIVRSASTAQLLVQVNGGPETLAVRRLLPRLAAAPRLYVIAHLTDIASPVQCVYVR